MRQAILDTVPRNTIGIAFSGGVDSTLLAKLCDDLGYDLTLLTIGFSESHDILFAKEVNNQLNLPHKILDIDLKSFSSIASQIHKKIDTNNLSWNENCIAFYYVSKLAKSLDIHTVVTANGIDELFCGYNAYRDVIEEGSDKVSEMMNEKLKNELEMMKAVNCVTSEFNVRLLQPLLSDEFIAFAKTIPVSEKIHGKDDLTRKHAIRESAIEAGVPIVAATKRKKALQYGSKIHKHLLKSR